MSLTLLLSTNFNTSNIVFIRMFKFKYKYFLRVCNIYFCILFSIVGTLIHYFLKCFPRFTYIGFIGLFHPNVGVSCLFWMCARFARKLSKSFLLFIIFKLKVFYTLMYAMSPIFIILFVFDSLCKYRRFGITKLFFKYIISFDLLVCSNYNPGFFSQSRIFISNYKFT